MYWEAEVKRKTAKSLAVLGAVLVLLAAAQLLIQESQIPQPERLTIAEPGGDLLAGSYYSGTQPAGVILAEGFGSDQIAMRSLLEAFSRSGYHVLTFDFSGHGRSPGGLGFDNAETDRLAYQIIAAKEAFKAKSSLQEGEIIVVGHSLGAREALQSAGFDQNPPGGLILLGTQVNLAPSRQAEVFTGVRDTDLAWVKSLSPVNPPVNIVLISGTWDDILPPQAASLLYEKLSGIPLSDSDQVGEVTSNNLRRILLVHRVLHNYEIYSRKVIQAAVEEAGRMSGVSTQPDISRLAQTRYLSWGAGVLGLFLLAAGLSLSLPGEIEDSPSTGLELERTLPFFRAKVLLWLPALLPGAILGGLIFLLPLGTPAFNLIYISFLGGYGLMLAVVYQLDRMPGVSGRVKFDFSIEVKLHTFLALAAFALTLLITAFFARTGWFFVLPANQRLAWAVIFTPITALGLWIGWQENALILKDAKNPEKSLLINLLIGLLPFFLYAGFLAAIGSLSGVVSQLQGLVILFFSIGCGIVYQKIGRNFLLTSLYQSFLIYWLILAQGVLFS